MDSSSQESAKEPSDETRPSKAKSYVNVLDEYCSRRRVTPVFQLISMEGMCHEPTFVYKVNVEGFEGQGQGRKKLEARQAAAKAVLTRMGILAEGASLESSPIKKDPKVQDAGAVEKSAALELDAGSLSGDVSGHAREEPALPDMAAAIPGVSVSSERSESGADQEPIVKIHTAASPQKDDAVKPDDVEKKPAARDIIVPPCRPENPVGSLQELTLSIRWPPPRFDLAGREGAAHDAVFTIACFVWSYKSLGKGKSKKEAKRSAAYNMYQTLRAAPEVLELWQKRVEAYQAKTNNNRQNRARQSVPRRSAPLQDMHKDLMSSTCESLKVLRASPPEIIHAHPDPLGFLQEIATEVGFDIFFDDLFDLTRPAKARGGLGLSLLEPQKSDPASVPLGVLRSLTLSESKTGCIWRARMQEHRTDFVDIPAENRRDISTVTSGSLITLTLPRQVVCFGTGPSKSAARRAATVDALCYLHIASLPSWSFHEPGSDGSEASSTQTSVSA